MRSSLSNEQKRGDRSLNILTKKALNQMLDSKGDESYPDKVNNQRVGVNNYLSQQVSARNQRISQSTSIYQSNTDRDNVSEKSSCIKKRVSNAMYSAFPELKDEKNIREIGDMQTKAQLDALKRFIQTMEDEAVAAKRTAQE